jgi:ABC-2 type transport system permease protein
MRLELVRRVARKELRLFFSSAIGYLFLASFLAVTLFVFFWGEAWFARNVADVRPMFEWMPILLIFLSAALTMRMWSEERRTGTLEFVATLPVSTWEFVLGKFLACWTLLAIALLLTVPLPISVAYIADLDWGPVVAGYLASFLLGGAYLAIGLFVSARTDSQIVSLIVAAFACSVFYLVGSPLVTDLFGSTWADALRALGSGSRFESITRGVLDLRDLYYYVSLLVVFLALNVHSLEVQRWARDGAPARHRAWRIGTTIVIANLLAANLWLYQFNTLRMDVTQGQIYSISPATRAYLAQLQEPLLIRGYFSAKTHPLLAPLVPQMRDLLHELEVAGTGKVRVEIIDPATSPQLEEEANGKYGIRPVPFQVADRYQASLVNSYFDVLVSYGDQWEVLGFRDLIEVKVEGESELDVQLRNPEYDVTRSIRKVLYGFQGGGSVFDNVAKPVKFVGYLSPDDRLPPALVEYRHTLQSVLEGLTKDGGDKFSAEVLDPEAGDGSLAKQIQEQYGFQPMAASLFDTNQFYFYLTLTDGDTVMQVPIPDALGAEPTRKAIEQGLKRFATGMMKSLALVVDESAQMVMGMPQPGVSPVEELERFLQQDFDVKKSDLADGVVPEGIELMMVIAPANLTEKQVFAIDQFLMQGGTVVLATAPYAAKLDQQVLSATPQNSGLEDWLAHQGLSLEDHMVMDPQNAAFPAPVTRQVGGFSFQELVMLDYPYFVDVRGAGLNSDNGITARLPQVTVPWASPIEVDNPPESGRTVTELLKSSAGSWLSTDPDVMPRIDESGQSAFHPSGETKERTLAVLLEGRFDSFFKGKPSPLVPDAESETAEPEEPDTDIEAATLDQDGDPADATEASAEDRLGVMTSVIERSPESARLFVIGSNSVADDQVLRVLGSADGTVYSNSLQFMTNIVDWSVEDRSLLDIRSRGHFNRTLPPLEEGQEMVVEGLNYALALLGLGVVFLWHRRRLWAEERRYSGWLKDGGAA